MSEISSITGYDYSNSYDIFGLFNNQNTTTSTTTEESSSIFGDILSEVEDQLIANDEHVENPDGVYPNPNPHVLLSANENAGGGKQSGGGKQGGGSGGISSDDEEDDDDDTYSTLEKMLEEMAIEGEEQRQLELSLANKRDELMDDVDSLINHDLKEGNSEILNYLNVLNGMKNRAAA